MDKEIKNFIKVWVSATISISYCYYFSSRIKTGVLRFLSVLPICVLFLIFPLFFSSTYLNFITSTFLSWHANLRLILFAFDKGPLFPLPSNLFQFVCFTSYPITPQQNPKSHQIRKNPSQDHYPKWLFPIKVLIFTLALHMYNYTQYLPRILLSGLYTLHVYLALEIPLTILHILASISLGSNLETLYNEPYLATSLQEFWGRRWNLNTTGLLRLTVFKPVRRICERVMNSELAIIIGVLATFLVSGLIHEVVFLYLTREMPTWEVTCFFVLHGVCTVVEVKVKRIKFARRWTVKPVVSRVLTVGFLVLTGHWLFFPQFKRSGVMESFAKEALLFNDFVKSNLFYLIGAT